MGKEGIEPTSFSVLPQISLSAYTYTLPDERIARYPTTPRDASKLLVYAQGILKDQVFHELPEQLPPNSLLVFNQTQVLPARLLLKRKTGAQIELLLLSPAGGATYPETLQSKETCTWEAMIGNKKRWKPAEALETQVFLDSKHFPLTVTWEDRERNLVRFRWEDPHFNFGEILESLGEAPLPPYLNRDFEPEDIQRYQTIYAKDAGAVAAPTAGLHFTESVFVQLKESGIAQCYVTLHVGAGTFAPIKTDNVAAHTMHAESFSLAKSTLLQLQKHEGPIIPVGTTSLRTLETIYWMGLILQESGNLPFTISQEIPYQYAEKAVVPYPEIVGNLLNYMEAQQLETLTGSSQLFIMPGYPFKVISGLITNFHQPNSSLVLLVAAWIGEDWRKVYQHALEKGYRFLSFGDSSLLLP